MAKKTKRRVVVAYWAESELAFIKFTRDLCESNDVDLCLRKISHHKNWFTAQRSYFRNSIHLAKHFFLILYSGTHQTVVFFGTNLCRIFFFFSWLFRNSHFVYNEMPSVSKGTLTYWIDRSIFKHARSVYVSTRERSEYVRRALNLSRQIGIIENITTTDISMQAHRTNRPLAAVYCGSITAKRFPSNSLKQFQNLVSYLGAPIDVYGPSHSSILPEFGHVLAFKGLLPHDQMLATLEQYSIGILSYYTEEPNYDYCAPLKLYEYIYKGCRVISVNRNRGLVAVQQHYPSLISFLDEINLANDAYFSDAGSYETERLDFIEAAIATNKSFARQILHTS